MDREDEPLHPGDVDDLDGLLPPEVLDLLRRVVEELENHRERFERLTELLTAHDIQED